jgi:hypothetical protein
MTRKISRTTLAILSFTLLSVCLAPSARGQACSVSNVAGKWAFSTNGNVIGIGPRVSAGIFTLDTAGNVLKGKATSSLNGAVTPEFFAGTYSVNPDCTGELTVAITDTSGNPLFTVSLAAYFDDGEHELRGIFSSVVAPNGAVLPTAIVLDARKIVEE